MHSAVHVAGRRLYDYARAGEEVARPSRQIEIDSLSRLAFTGAELTVQVTCSKGTYIRTLAQAIGEALGCGAYLVALRRTAVGPFLLRDAASLEALEVEPRDAVVGRLLDPQVLVAGLRRLDATPEETDHFVHGRQVVREGDESLEEVAVFAPGGRFLGVGRGDGAGRIAPLRLMAEPRAKFPDFA